MKKLFILALATFGLCGYTIKATGQVRVVIVAPEEIQFTYTEPDTVVVYTEVGPTLQVVF